MKKLSIKKNALYGIIKNSSLKPVSLDINLFGNNHLILSSGEKIKASCLNCIEHPCISYNLNQMDVLVEMPYNTNLKVCPVDAINILQDGFPAINDDLCVGCGICISRCTYGAININNKFIAEIHRDEHTKVFDWIENLSIDKYKNRHDAFSNISMNFIYNRINKKYFENLYDKVLKSCKKTNGTDNLFVRNLFLNLGLNNKIRAVGNNDIRFDLIGLFEDKIIIGEIGLNGIDILEEPRAILDDVAILYSRYGINKEKIIPVIITLLFPNKRSDVYEVIYDINNVLGIRISTLSFHSLILFNLFRIKTNFNNLFNWFYMDKQNKSIANAANRVFPEIINVDPYYPSEYYEAIK